MVGKSYLVVVVDHLAGVDDGEVRLEALGLCLRVGPDEHVLGEVVLPRQLRDDAHVLPRLGARAAVAVEHVPVFFFIFSFLWEFSFDLFDEFFCTFPPLIRRGIWTAKILGG